MKCPGQDMQYWKADAIFDVECPQCHKIVEFYKDDTSRKCYHCGHRFVNPKMDFGCASYCQYAEQCLGALPEEFAGARDNLLKDKVAVGMKRYYGKDFRKIRLASTMARHAENICKLENGNLAVTICAAYLYGVPAADVREILYNASVPALVIEEICRTLEEVDLTETQASIAVQIIRDALSITAYQEKVQQGSISPSEAKTLLETKLANAHGKAMLAGLTF